MLKLLVAPIGAGTGLFLFKFLVGLNADHQQAKLEQEVKAIADRAKIIQDKLAADEKKTQEKVDEISKEQSENPTGDDLAKWFVDHNNKG